MSQLFASPWTASHQASLSSTISLSFLKLMSIESQWCLPTISSSVAPFPCPQFFPPSGSFLMSQLFTSGGQSIGASASASVLPMNIQDWFPLELTGLIKRKDKICSADAKSLQLFPTLCDRIDGSSPGSAVPGILQARTLEWVAISFSNAWKWKVKVKSLSCVRLFSTPWTAAYQAPPSMGFSRQECWSGLPLPSPQIL